MLAARELVGTAVTLGHIWGKQVPYLLKKANAQSHAWVSRVEQDSYAIIPNFYTAEQCAEAIAEFERIAERYPEYVRRRSDRRVFGANRVSATLNAFATHPELVEVTRRFHDEQAVSCLTLAAHLPYTPGNQGSGEGWHRDSYRPQFKTMLYLTDVTEENGPFQIVPGSHRALDMVADTVLHRVTERRKRFTEDEIERIVSRRYPAGVHTLTGRAGTLILACTGALHRGKPIEAGERYALTNYFFSEATVPASAESLFQAIPLGTL